MKEIKHEKTFFFFVFLKSVFNYIRYVIIFYIRISTFCIKKIILKIKIENYPNVHLINTKSIVLTQLGLGFKFCHFSK